MPKVPTTTERPKALDTMVAITEMVLAFRMHDRTPNLVDIGRAVIDERISCENAAVMTIAKKRQLVK
jgi:hypothetical protein